MDVAARADSAAVAGSLGQCFGQGRLGPVGPGRLERGVGGLSPMWLSGVRRVDHGAGKGRGGAPRYGE